MGALLALASSVLWGSGDFLGGRATRRWGALRVLFWSQAATLVLMAVAALGAAAAGGVTLTAGALVIGAAGGCAGVIALAAFYRALAAGPMSVVGPVAGLGVVLPVAVGIATGETPNAMAIAGICVAVAGVVLASVGAAPPITTAARRIAPRTLLLSLVAALGFAAVFIALDLAAGSSAGQALVATAGVRIGSFGTLLTALVVLRRDPGRGVGLRTAAGFAGIGLLDTGANLLFAMAAAFGELEVVAVLGSLYPAVTSLLAHLVLGERLGRLQLLGVALALGGIALAVGG